MLFAIARGDRDALCRRVERGGMDKAQEGIEARLLEGKSLDAANDPVIDGVQPVSGWDPFEIWRTRVRNLRLGSPPEGQDSID